MTDDTQGETVSSLTKQYNREELDKWATDVGLDPSSYATKEDLAEALLAAGDQPDAETATEASNPDVIPDEYEVDPDPTPGERLDTGEDIGKTLPVEAGGEILEAPAAAVLDPGPPPITPASSQQAYHDRVAFEQGVEAQLATWWDLNRAAVLNTFLAGGEVELTHNVPDDDAPDDDTTPVAKS